MHDKFDKLVLYLTFLLILAIGIALIFLVDLVVQSF